MANPASIAGRRPTTVTVAASPRFLAPESNFIATIGMAVLYLYVFLVYSRVLEFLGVGTVTLILLALLIPLVLVSGNLNRLAQDRTARLLIPYFLWLLAATIFSTWRGGSIAVIVHRAGRAMLLYIAIVVLIGRLRDFMRLVWTVVLANFLIVVMALTKGVPDEGRLVLGSGTFRDPNELALFTLFGLSFWVLVASRIPPLARLFPIFAAMGALVVFGKSGSRGGLIALTALMAAYFWVASLASKVKLVLALLFVIGLAPLVLPGYIRARFMTFFSASEDSEYSNMLQGNDIASSISRREVQLQAVRLTLQNPIFGVGPGEFADVMYKSYKAGQGKFINHATHNSYLQIASENGIPAVLLFIAAMGVCLRQKPKIQQAGYSVMASPGPRLRSPAAITPDYAIIVHYSRMALIFVAVFAITLSFAYDDIMLMAMALMTAATNAASNEMAASPVKNFPAIIRRVGPALGSTKPRLRTT